MLGEISELCYFEIKSIEECTQHHEPQRHRYHRIKQTNDDTSTLLRQDSLLLLMVVVA